MKAMHQIVGHDMAIYREVRMCLSNEDVLPFKYVFTKESRELNRQLGLHKVNKHGNNQHGNNQYKK